MSTTPTAQKGFRPVGALNGDYEGQSRKYRTLAHNKRAIFKGDPVYIAENGTGAIQVYIGGLASANTVPLLGVVTAVYDSNGKPFTHSLPGGGPFIPASTAGFVMVQDDPDTIFEAQLDVSASPSMIGQFVNCSAGAAVTAAGLSGMELTGVVVTAAGEPFQIMGLSPSELDELGGSGNKVLVKISNHYWRRQQRLAPFAE